MVARYVPKFKHFGTTPVLDTRLATVVAIVNMGYEKFYKRLLTEILEPDCTFNFVLSGVQKIQKKRRLTHKRN